MERSNHFMQQQQQETNDLNGYDEGQHSQSNPSLEIQMLSSVLPSHVQQPSEFQQMPHVYAYENGLEGQHSQSISAIRDVTSHEQESYEACQNYGNGTEYNNVFLGNPQQTNITVRYPPGTENIDGISPNMLSPLSSYNIDLNETNNISDTFLSDVDNLFLTLSSTQSSMNLYDTMPTYTSDTLPIEPSNNRQAYEPRNSFLPDTDNVNAISSNVQDNMSIHLPLTQTGEVVQNVVFHQLETNSVLEPSSYQRNDNSYYTAENSQQNTQAPNNVPLLDADTQPGPSNHGQNIPTIIIEKEPSKFFAFSSKSDVENKQVASKKIAAEIKLVDLPNHIDHVVVCKLYEKFPNGDVKLSHHLLKSTWADCGHQPQCRDIGEDGTVVFDEMFVVKTKKIVHKTKILKRKIASFKAWTRHKKEIIKEEFEAVKDYVTENYGAKIKDKQVYTLQLCFEIYRELSDERQLIGEPKYSASFTNGLVIANNDQANKFRVGDNVKLQVFGAKKGDTNVRIYGTDQNVPWQKIFSGNIERSKISFKMPMIEQAQNTAGSLKCQLEVSSKSSEVVSEPITLYVETKLVSDAFTVKMIAASESVEPIQQPERSAIETALKKFQKLLPKSPEKADTFDDIVRFDLKFRAQNDGKTIFHAVIEYKFGILIKLYQLGKIEKLRKLIREAVNKRKQNLLHYACILKKPECIKPLLSMTCAIHEQDLDGNTPLHIIAEQKEEQLVKLATFILKNRKEYPDATSRLDSGLLKDLCNNEGYSVCQLAQRNKLKEFLQSIDECCQNTGIDELNKGLEDLNIK